MVHEAVDHGCGDDVVAEDFTPPADGLVAGHDQAGAFVAGRDELEEQVGCFGFEWDVSDLVDDQQRDECEFDQFVLEAVAVVGGGEAVDPLCGGGERDAVAGLTGSYPQADRQVFSRCRAVRGTPRSAWRR